MRRILTTRLAHASAGLALLAISDVSAQQPAAPALSTPPCAPLMLPERPPALILAAGDFSCAIVGADGRIACWGDDTNGELGDGKRLTREECPTPPPACAIYADIPPASELAARDPLFPTVAQRKAREAELRFLERPSCSTRPLLLSLLRGARGLVNDVRIEHVCASFDDGSVRCWGSNDDISIVTATELRAMRGARQLAFSSFDIIGRQAGRTVTTTFDWSEPLPRDFGDWISVVETANGEVCALRRDGSVRCSSTYAAGSLRDQRDCWSSPFEPSCAPTGLERATTIAAGYDVLCALDPSGQLLCWGERGHVPGIDSRVPALVDTPAAFRQVVIGGAHVCALDVHDAVWCFGNNGVGQLGDGTLQDSATPVQVDGLPPIAQLAAGAAHTCARSEDGELWCWGDNTHGQLGDGTRERRTQPVRVREPLPASRGSSTRLSPRRP